MADRYEKMIRRVGKSFYDDNISAVRNAVHEGAIDFLIKETEAVRSDIVTVKFRVRAMASAVRQGYDR